VGSPSRTSGALSVLQFLAVISAAWVLVLAVSTLPLVLTVAVALAIGAALSFLLRPEWALLFVLFVRASTDLGLGSLLIVGSRGEVIGGAPNVGLVLILILAGGIYILSHSVPMLSLPGGRLLALLLIAGLIGMARSDDLLLALNEWLPVLASFATYALAAYLFRTPEKIRRAVDVIMASFILPASFGLYQLVTGKGMVRPEFPVPRIFGTFAHPNSFGFYLVLVLGLFLCQTISGSSRRRLIALLSLLATFVLLVGTFTRVAWVGALIVLVVIGIVRMRILLPLLPLVSLIVVSLTPAASVRLSGLLEAGGSLADRVYNLWPATLRAWLLATGSEAGSFLVLLNRLSGLGPGVGPALGRFGLWSIPHNDYLRVLVEYGILGLVLYLALTVTLAVVAFRTWQESAKANPTLAPLALWFLTLTVAYPVMSITDNIFAHTANQIYFWTSAGITVAIRQLNRG